MMAQFLSSAGLAYRASLLQTMEGHRGLVKRIERHLDDPASSFYLIASLVATTSSSLS